MVYRNISNEVNLHIETHTNYFNQILRTWYMISISLIRKLDRIINTIQCRHPKVITFIIISTLKYLSVCEITLFSIRGIKREIFSLLLLSTNWYSNTTYFINQRISIIWYSLIDKKIYKNFNDSGEKLLWYKHQSWITWLFFMVS